MPRGIPKKNTAENEEIAQLLTALTITLNGSPLGPIYKASALLTHVVRTVNLISRNDPKTYFSESMNALGTLSHGLKMGFGDIEIEKKREYARLKMQRRRARKKTAAPVVVKAAVVKAKKKSGKKKR